MSLSPSSSPVFEGKAAFVDKIDSFINNGFRYRSHLLLSGPVKIRRVSLRSEAKLDNFEYMNVTFKLTGFLRFIPLRENNRERV